MITNRKPPLCVTLRAARDAAPPGASAPQPDPADEPWRLVAREAVRRRERPTRAARPHARQTSRLVRYELHLPLDNWFSIEDAGTITLNFLRGDKADVEMFAATPSHCLLWAPFYARGSMVVELRDVPPGEEDLGDWDHVVEFGLALPSGRLRIVVGETADFPVLRTYPVPHRARLCFGNLASVPVVDGRPVGGFVRYRLTLWPSDHAAGAVVKPWKGAASPDRDGPPASADPAAPGDDAGGGRGADLGGRVEWALGAGDFDEFIARVFHRMQGALVDLEELLDALQGDARVGTEHRHALAAELDHIKYAHLEEWELGLLDGGAADAG